MSELVLDLECLRYDERGLVTVVVQDEASGAVLMVAWSNREALELTVASGKGHFFSRSRQQLWRKGETSGNELDVQQILVDCDADTLIYRVRPHGPACHLGTRTCFEPNPATLELGWLARVLADRAEDADQDASYTARLLARGVARVAQKVGEEGVETVIAGLTYDRSGSGEDRAKLVGESADLIYHLLVLLQVAGVDAQEIGAELQRRHVGRTVGSEGGGGS